MGPTEAGQRHTQERGRAGHRPSVLAQEAPMAARGVTDAHQPYRLGSTSCNARIRAAGSSRMLQCCSTCTNLPDELVASVVHASGEPFERRPCALSVPHRLLAVRRPSGGQLQLPAVPIAPEGHCQVNRCAGMRRISEGIVDIPLFGGRRSPAARPGMPSREFGDRRPAAAMRWRRGGKWP